MGKARMTFRFDREGKPEQTKMNAELQHEDDREPTEEVETVQPPTPEKRAVPLREDEYRVVLDPPQDTQYLNQYTYDFGAWSSPFDMETEKLEQIIRDSDPSTSSERPQRDKPSPVWSEPEIADEPLMPRFVKHSKPPWHKIFGSFIAAVATGVVVGFIVLSLFSNPDSLPDALFDAAGSEIQGGIQTPPSNTDSPGAGDDPEQSSAIREATEPDAGVADAGMVGLQLPEQSYYMLQNGVFSTVESAELAKKALDDAGFAGMIYENESDGSFYVYAAVLQNRDNALWLAHQLQAQQFETYIKSFVIPAATSVQWNGDEPEMLQQFVAESHKLAQMFIGVSFLHLQKDEPIAPEESTLTEVTQQHLQWNETLNAISTAVPESVEPVLKQMSSVMNTAVVSLDEYRKNPSHSYQWQIQGSMIQFLTLQKQMLEQIAPATA